MSGSSQNDYSWEDICHVAHSHWLRFRLNPMWRLPFDIQSVEPDHMIFVVFLGFHEFMNLELNSIIIVDHKTI